MGGRERREGGVKGGRERGGRERERREGGGSEGREREERVRNDAQFSSFFPFVKFSCSFLFCCCCFSPHFFSFSFCFSPFFFFFFFLLVFRIRPDITVMVDWVLQT